jgi:hypothetical protein
LTPNQRRPGLAQIPHCATTATYVTINGDFASVMKTKKQLALF